MLPRSALALSSHSCCRCGASRLMSGPVCSSDVPAKEAGLELLCSGKLKALTAVLLCQAGLPALSAASLVEKGAG